MPRLRPALLFVVLPVHSTVHDVNPERNDGSTAWKCHHGAVDGVDPGQVAIQGSDLGLMVQV